MRAFRPGKDLNFVLNKLEIPIPENDISHSLFCKDDFFLLCLLTSKKIKKLRFKLPYDILTWVMQNCGNFWNQCEQNLFVSISSGNQNIQR